MFIKNTGYKVSLKGRSGVLYSEGEKKASIEAEMLLGETDLVIYLGRLTRWDPPFQEELLTEDDKQKIKNNITSELQRKGMKIEWD